MSEMGTKLSAEKRIEKLIDASSFVEMDKYLERSNAVLGYADVSAPGEGVITGWATIEGRPVYVCAQDYSVLKGSFSAAHAKKINKAFDMAAKQGMPVICIWDCGGSRIQEGAAALDAVASVLKKMTDVSGVVPVISIVAGNLFGSAAVLSALSDFTVAIRKITAVSIPSPMVVASKEGLDVDADAICGADVQGKENGNAQLVCSDEEEAIETVKGLLRYLPSNNLEEAPYEELEDPADRITVAGAQDVKALISDIADNNEFFELYKDYADDMVAGFITLNGCPVGVIANVPGKNLSVCACRMAARFISFLDAYDMPILSIVNNEGVKVSSHMIKHCQLRSVAKLIAAYNEAGCPMVSLITGKAIGEGYVAMSNKANGADIVYAYPTAEISCVEAEAGAIILYDGEKSKAEEFKAQFSTPMAAAKQGIIDDIIEPADTRKALIKAIEMASNKREQKLPKKHGVMPL